MKNIVLVHGGFVDGAGWEGVYKILKRDGYSVSIVQNPTISLEDDVAVLVLRVQPVAEQAAHLSGEDDAAPNP